MSQLAGRVLETALTEHLGYPPGQAPPGRAGNHRAADSGVVADRRVDELERGAAHRRRHSAVREKDAFAASVDDRHWKPAAAPLLAPALLAAHSSRPMGEVLRWLARVEAESTVDEIANVLATGGADVALDVLLGLQDATAATARR